MQVDVLFNTRYKWARCVACEREIGFGLLMIRFNTLMSQVYMHFACFRQHAITQYQAENVDMPLEHQVQIRNHMTLFPTEVDDRYLEPYLDAEFEVSVHEEWKEIPRT